MTAKRKILVVDDSKPFLDMTQLRLLRAGYQVVAIDSPANFAMALSREKPDLVLMDVSMPVVQGQSLVELAKKHRLHACPLVLYSGLPDERLAELVRSSGADGFISKTQSADALLVAIERFLGKSGEGAAPGREAAPQGAPELERLRRSSDLVFIVDGHAMSRLFLEQYVRKAGCEPVTFDRAASCLDELRRRRPAMVLVDLEVERREGLCQSIREHAEWAAIPVVMMTGTEAPEEIMRCWRAGADDVIPKPVRADPIESRICVIRAARQASAAAGREGGATKRVLLMEGSRFLRNVLGVMLEQSGYGVLYAADGLEALRLAEQYGSGIDALVVDLELPSIDGVSVLRRLRERRCQAPAIALTGTGVDAQTAALVQSLTGAPVFDKRALPYELLVSRLNSTLRRVTPTLRVGERVPFFSLVEFRVGEGSWKSGFSYDLSSQGIFVRTLTPEARGKTVEMRVRMGAHGREMIFRGLVAWANAYGSRSVFSYPVGMGVQFSQMDAEQQTHLKALVKSMAAHGPTARAA